MRVKEEVRQKKDYGGVTRVGKLGGGRGSEGREGKRG